MQKKTAVYRKVILHRLCQGKMRDGNGMKRIRQYLFFSMGIFLCAFFSCAGIQMIKQDAGVLQMEMFRPDQETFRSFSISRQADESLEALAETSGVAYEKLLAAFMLKHRFSPENAVCKTEVLSDTLGYERLDEERFAQIVSYYKDICSCVEYLPVCSIYSKNSVNDTQLYYDAEKQLSQAAAVRRDTAQGQDEEKKGWQLQILFEEEDQGLVPVVCMKTGTVVSQNLWENALCLQLEEGIQMIYGNLEQDLREWEEGEVIESGELIGSVSGAGGLLLVFRLRITNDTWADFNGSFSLFHGDKKVRSVTRMLP